VDAPKLGITDTSTTSLTGDHAYTPGKHEDGWFVMDQETARQIAERLVRNQWRDRPDGDELMISKVEEHPWGWMYLYTSRRYLETGDDQYAVFGNAPYIVDRRDGSVHATGTADSPEWYAAEYAAGRHRCPIEVPDDEHGESS
jgi:hypothetical protein